MKGTRHNGRSGKDGVYNPLHNDRRFDPEHSEHIDNERVRQNIYWDCYQGYTTMADRGKEDNFSFNQIEMAYYVDHYSDYVINQNKRHEKARHPDRCKGVEDVLKNKKTCPEESIYQLGTIDEHASVETLVLVFDATNRYGEIEPKQEAALEELGFELPNPEKKRSKTNNRKVVFDSACRTMFLDICKRHGLEIDEEPSYGGRQHLEKQDYIRMKQKEEIAVQQEMLNQQRDKVNANHLELARQSNHVRANEKVIQSQKEKIEQQEKEFKENFISNSDRILSQGELLEEQREELQQLTLRIEDVENLLDEVSSEAYDKAVDKVAEETMRATRKDDIRLAEDSKRWIQSPERKASRKEKEYAINRLDGLIKKIEYAMEKAVVRVVRQLKQPEKKKAVVEEIKKEVKPSIREKLALNVAKIQREEAERKQLNKGRSHSSDLEL